MRLTLTLLHALPRKAHAKDMIPTPPDDLPVGAFEPFLAAKFKSLDNPDAKLADFADDPEFQALVAKHDLHLFGGPMLGQLTHQGAAFWVRTAKEAEVQILSWPKDTDPNTSSLRTDPIKTTKANDLAAVLHLTGLKPGTSYDYKVLIDGEPAPLVDRANYQFTTPPAPGTGGNIRIAFGGGARYNPPKELIWDTIAKSQPHAFLFLGDNLYIDLPERRDTQRLYYYRRQLRPEFRRLVAGSATYAIWDDHDFGDNDSEGGPAIDVPAWKRPVWNVFRENWANPSYGGGEKLPGCWFKFRLGDVEFFMTDGRYYRAFKGRKGAEKTMLGPEQKAWLLDSLKTSDATFRVLCSGTLWTEHADKGGADSWWGCKEEREEIFSLIDKENIGGVVLLSADRHRTDIYRIDRPDGYPLYEFETSKLTNNHTHPTNDKALFSYNEGNFFGLIDFDTSAEDPTLTFRCISNTGATIHTHSLKRSQLQK